MQKFYDYDIEHPFDVTDEKHIIEGGLIRLNYIPQFGSVTIDGFKESNGASIESDEFFIDYSVNTKYRMATGIVIFGDGNDGKDVTVNYKGVSTIVLAKHMNEIKEFMENEDSSLLDNRGEVAAITGKEPDYGMTISEINDNGYSISTGNVLTLGGAEGCQFAIGRDADGNNVVCYRVRAKDTDKWSPWINLSAVDYVDERIREIVGSAPDALDTLQELAYALGEDANFSATITAKLGEKLDSAGGTITGDLTVDGTITGNLVGDVTGNVSGSAGSCTGNSETATNATNDEDGNNIKGSYVHKANGEATGTFSIGAEGSDDGGKLLLKASDGAVEQSGIKIEQWGSVLRIYGIPSADGETKTGQGEILVIDPYGKTISGDYTFNGIALKATNDANGKKIDETYLSGVQEDGKKIIFVYGDGTKKEITTKGEEYGVFTQPTDTANGTSGLCPAPLDTDKKYLCSDGTWKTASDIVGSVDITAKNIPTSNVGGNIWIA